jgi:hypothetical protein
VQQQLFLRFLLVVAAWKVNAIWNELESKDEGISKIITVKDESEIDFCSPR